MKKLAFFLLSAAALCLLLCLGVFAESVPAEFRVGGKAEITGTTAPDGSIRLPDLPETSGGTCVGWALEEDGKLYPAGFAYVNPSYPSLHFRAQTVAFSTYSGAAVSFDGARLRFDGGVSLTDKEAAEALSATLKFGILTAPLSEVYGGGKTFTADCGAPGLLKTASSAFLYEAKGQGVFSAATGAIPAEAFARRYAARAYLEVTYDCGTSLTVYAAFRPAYHARSLHAVASMATEDRAETYSAAYPTATDTVLGKYYSPYTPAELSALAAYLDRVICVEDTFAANGDLVGGTVADRFTADGVNFYTFRFYSSPYAVTGFSIEDGEAVFRVTAKEGGDISDIAAYYVGGSYRAPTGEERTAGAYVVRERVETVPE